MDFNEWEGWYKEILDTLGFSREGDENTAALLDKILDEKGCLTIEEFFDEIMEKKDTSKFIVLQLQCLKMILFQTLLLLT